MFIVLIAQFYDSFSYICIHSINGPGTIDPEREYIYMDYSVIPIML